MIRSLSKLMLGLGALFMLSGAANAETKVTLSGVHLCCPACVSAVGKTLKDVAGVKGECSQTDKTITITADNNETAQKAIDALAAAGFHGKPDNDAVKFKPVDAPTGNVKKLEVSGVHNCCGQCTKAIKAAVGKVKGVTSDNVVAKNDSFVVEGDFSAAELVEALLKEGFHVAVKK
jgi:periplasmic mercuric ion binding protein